MIRRSFWWWNIPIPLLPCRIRCCRFEIHLRRAVNANAQRRVRVSLLKPCRRSGTSVLSPARCSDVALCYVGDESQVPDWPSDFTRFAARTGTCWFNKTRYNESNQTSLGWHIMILSPFLLRSDLEKLVFCSKIFTRNVTETWGRVQSL